MNACISNKYTFVNKIVTSRSEQKVFDHATIRVSNVIEDLNWVSSAKFTMIKEALNLV